MSAVGSSVASSTILPVLDAPWWLNTTEDSLWCARPRSDQEGKEYECELLLSSSFEEPGIKALSIRGAFDFHLPVLISDAVDGN